MKALLVAFSDSDRSLGGGISAKLGADFDIVQVPTSELADSAAHSLWSLVEGYAFVLASSSMRAKDVMARLAGLMDAAMVTDVTEVTAPNRFIRPILAGTLFELVETLSSPVVLTFRPSGFESNVASEGRQVAWSGTAVERGAVCTGQDVRSSARPDLSQAKRIVSGGRPLGDKETFEKVIGGLADKLSGAVGATRAAVDSGIAANELQVGQTGKIVAPDLYIAAGISGSTQHMAGIKDSKCIVAINKDPDAPIFESADFGLVADLFEAVPEFTSKV